MGKAGDLWPCLRKQQGQPDLFEVHRTPTDKGMDADARIYGSIERADGSADALAAMVSSGKLKGHEAAVLAVLRRFPGMTATEVEPHVPYNVTETRRRCSSLLAGGHVTKGERRMCKVLGKKVATYWPVKGNG